MWSAVMVPSDDQYLVDGRHNGRYRDLTRAISGRTSLVAGIGSREPGHMEAAEITSMRPGNDEAATQVRRFVVLVGEPGDGGSAFRIEDPARLLRVWSLLQATFEQLEGTTLPPERMPGLQQQLKAIRRELERAVSPPLAAELRRILPPRDAAPNAGELRIECAALASWVASLVMQMLAVFVAARERSQQADGDAASAYADAAHGSGK
jgi:Protein of unknown function (DUF2587)